MNASSTRRLRRLAALAVAAVAVLFVTAASAMAAPRLNVQPSVPAEVAPGAEFALGALTQNVGDEATTGPLSLKITVPSGFEPEPGWCPFSEPVLSCEGESLEPAGQANIGVRLTLAPGISPGVKTLTFEASAAGAPPVTKRFTVTVAPSGGTFGVVDAEGAAQGVDGSDFTQAGGHPDVLSVGARLKTKTNQEGKTIPGGSLEDMAIEFPPGFVGDPTATTKCGEAELARLGEIFTSSCPTNSQIGTVELNVGASGGPMRVGLFNMHAPKDVPARFGFNLLGVVVHADAEVRSGGDYGITARARGLQQILTVYGMKVNLWGVPADSSHGDSREICGVNHLIAWPGFGCPIESSLAPAPFVTLPTSCTPAGQGLEGGVEAFSWEGQTGRGRFEDRGSTGEPEGTTGCDRIPFSPDLTVRPDTSSAAAPAGLHVDLTVPQNKNPKGVSTAHLRDATVKLPLGVTVNATSAGGTAGCTSAQIALRSSGPAGCPDASKLGTVRIQTPLLEEELTGNVYLASPGDNPFNSLLAMYVVAEGAGVVVKLPGKIATDPRTGQVVVSFDDNPQLPFSRLSMDLAGGEGAPLVSPDRCGTYTTEFTLTSWAGQSVEGSSSFAIDRGCATGGFSPGFSAGTTDPTAGKYSPFELRVTRGDGEANLAAIRATLPEGLLAKLAGVPLCGDAAAASGDCPAASQVGTTAVGVGAGTNPLYVPQAGKAPTGVYLGGPYKGAPYSLVVKVPAQAGPFDLGTVVVRNALRVDPTTTQVTAESDPLPQILEGIPIAYRDVRVQITRPEFTVNPTDCSRMAVSGVLTSAAGQSAGADSPFAAANCERLAFKPALALRMTGQLKRTGNPALTATLKAPDGQANIAKTTVVLPKSMFIDQSHVNNPCTRVQFNENACPEKSVLGTATAWSPLLDQPLTGPVYFRSNGGERRLPDLVADLNGQIHVVLVGFIDSVKAGKEASRVRTRFLSVPDAPVSKFVLQLKGGRLGLIENSVDLCRSPQKATVKTEGQNGKAADFTQPISTSCPKAKQTKPNG